MNKKEEYILITIGYFLAGAILALIMLNSCRKEELITPPQPPTNTIVEFNEDSVSNKLGCYYPITSPN